MGEVGKGYEALRARLDELLVEDLDTNSRLKAQVKTHLAGFDEDDGRPMRAAGLAMLQLHDALGRKTSPLHLRLVHAAGRLYQEQDADGDAVGFVVIVNEICEMMRRPDLRSPLPA